MSIRQLCNVAYALLLKNFTKDEEREEFIESLYKPLDGSAEQAEALAAEAQAFLAGFVNPG